MGHTAGGGCPGRSETRLFREVHHDGQAFQVAQFQASVVLHPTRFHQGVTEENGEQFPGRNRGGHQQVQMGHEGHPAPHRTGDFRAMDAGDITKPLNEEGAHIPRVGQKVLRRSGLKFRQGLQQAVHSPGSEPGYLMHFSRAQRGFQGGQVRNPQGLPKGAHLSRAQSREVEQVQQGGRHLPLQAGEGGNLPRLQELLNFPGQGRADAGQLAQAAFFGVTGDGFVQLVEGFGRAAVGANLVGLVPADFQQVGQTFEAPGQGEIDGVHAPLLTGFVPGWDENLDMASCLSV